SVSKPTQAHQEANQAEVDKLQAQIQALQQTVQVLQQQGTTTISKPVANSASKAAKEQPRVKSRSNRVNLHQIYPVLGAATRQDLAKMKELWGDMLNMLSVPQRSLLHVSQPVAASPDGIIVA